MKADGRYHGLDFLRGCMICSMIIYHAIWDIVYLFEKEWPWFEQISVYWWQQSICWGFILLSGFCWNLGKKQWRRGATVFTIGILFSCVITFVMPDDCVWFGVLLFIGSAMICMVFLDKVLSRMHPVLGIVLFFCLFVITRNCNYRFLGFEAWNIVALPDVLYANWITTFFGFPLTEYYLMDYFGLFPWIFLFITGYFLYMLFEKYHWMHVWRTSRCRWLEWLGRYSLIIYVVHQPIVYVFLIVLDSTL